MTNEQPDSYVSELIQRWNTRTPETKKYRERGNMKRELEGLLKAEMDEGAYVPELLSAYRTLFDWETDYSITTYWKAEINNQIESNVDCDDAEEANAYLNGDKDFYEPDKDDYEVSKHIEFSDGEPFDRELEVSISDLRTKLQD